MNIPNDPDAEAAVIGACLFSDEPVRWTAEWLSPSDFYTPKWRNAVQAVLSLHAKGQGCDPVTVSAEATRLGVSVLSADLITALSNSPAPSAVTRYGHIIRRHSVSRSILAVCTEASLDINKQGHDPDELLDSLIADLRSVDSHVPTGRPDGYMTFEELRSKPQEQRAPMHVTPIAHSVAVPSA